MLATVFTKSTLDRWRGVIIAVVSLGLMLLMAMAVYRDFDLAIYDQLPAALREAMGIPEGADAAGLGIGVLFAFYGAMTMGGLAVSIGASSIAGEEKDGTIGILLGNPKSRSHVYVAKAVAMVSLIAVGAVLLWGATYAAASLLNVDLGEMNVGAYSFHLGINALFYGFLAMAVGSWTGRRGLASGVAAGVMVLSFFAVGILPLVENLADVAKAFPWYYFDSSQPVVNGVDWGHIGILGGGSAVMGALGFVGINRRDLRGKSVGVTLVDRLRNDPRTRKLANRLAGAARVSRIWIKTASEHQGLLIVSSLAMFGVMGVMLAPIYAAMDETLLEFTKDLPQELFAFAGAQSGNMSTPEGFYEVESFGLMAPIAIMVVTIAIGARALAGEERQRTMGLLLANPVSRTRVLAEKTATMLAYGAVVGFATFAGVSIGSVIGGLGMSIANIGATSLLATLVGLVFGAVALALGAFTGSQKVAAFGAVAAALGFHLLTSIARLSEGLTGLGRLSPFHYYLTSDPLANGMPWGHGLVLTVILVALIVASVVAFNRRDLRQSG